MSNQEQSEKTIQETYRSIKLTKAKTAKIIDIGDGINKEDRK